MYRTTIIYRLYSQTLNKSFISYTTNVQRALWNLKCYEATNAKRSKSRDIIRQGDYQVSVLAEMPENVFTVEELDKYKNLEDQEVLVNPAIVHLTVDEKKKKYREKYHETGEQLGYYYQNREKILRANVLKRLSATEAAHEKRESVSR
ncbi:unnamed protein product [Bathycoccus prasinos]